MSNIKVTVQDANNLLLEVTPVPIQQIAIDRGVAGRGVTDVTAVEIDNSLYLVFTFSDGTTETVGPVGTIQYIGQAPIVVTGSTISLSTVPVNLGGTGATTASGARTNLGLGTIATQNASSVAITGGTITGITDLAVADGGTGSSTAAGAMVNLLPSYTGNANKRLGLDGTATGLEWVTDGGGTVTSVDASGGTTGLTFTGGPITTSGTLTLGGTLDLDNGGTGATTAAGARTNLNAVDQALTLTAGTGLSGGGDLTANRSFSITNTGVTAAAYGAASKTLTATVNAQGQLTVLADTPIAIANTQISGLGTMSTQNSNSVAITGGSITGITDLAVADGGTGASDAAGARTNLNAANQATTITAGTGLLGGGDLSANRTIDIANTTVTAGAFGSASNTLTATVNAQGQLTALAATPIAIANTQISGLGTMSTQNSNAVTITGGSITGITDLAIADGGTGASNAPDARSNLGLGSAAVLNAGVALGVATLDAGGTVPLSQIPASIQGGVSYQGSWNAATNTPTLVSSVGSKGYYYVVSTSGSTNLNGVTDWLVGDWAIFNGSIWQKIDNTDQVASVNGYTGVVVLSNTDVGAPPTSLTISAGTGLSGGGSLAANRTISIANTTVTAAPYGTASAVPTFTVNGQGQLTAASNVTIAIANTQVSGLGTMSTQNANSVAITGGSITGITDLAIADGGTGASTAGGALTNLGAIGSITSSDGSIVVVPSGTSVDLAVSAASPASTLLTQVRNTTGATLAKGTVVYISGATGQISTVSKAIATGDTTSAQTLGMITSNLANNTNGYVTVFGLLTNIDTSAYTDGAQLYLSGTVAGAVTATKPSAPIHLVYVAIVEYAHPTQGKILVKVQNGYELDEIHDVSIVSPVTGQTLVYNSSTDLWVNNTVSLTAGVNGTLPIANGGTGQTTANAAFNALAPSQTGNASKYLQTDGSNATWDAISLSTADITGILPVANGGTGLSTLTAGYIPFGAGTSAFNSSANLFWDSANFRLGIGTTTPSVKLDVSSSATASTAWFTSSATTAYSPTTSASVLNARLHLFGGSATSAYTAIRFSQSGASEALFGAVQNASGTLDFIWQGYNGTAYAERARLDALGNFGIGVTSPSSKLHVGGTFRQTDATISYGYSVDTSSNKITYAALYGGGYFAWQTNNSGSDRMTLDISGNLLVGTTTNTNTSKLVSSGTISQTVGSTQYLVVDQSDIGTGANEIPLNQYLGALAYQDNVSLTTNDITGVLPTANGGTGLSSFTSGGVVYASSASALTTGSALTFNGTSLTVGGSATEKISTNGSLRVSGAVSANATGGILSYQGSGTTMLGAWGANTSTVGQIQFYVSSSDGSVNGEIMRVTGSGLGIGTSSPTNPLSVTGNANFSGQLGVGGATISTSALYISNSALSSTTQFGVFSAPVGTSAATGYVAAYTSVPSTAATAFTAADVMGLRMANAVKGAGSTITNQHGLYIVDQTNGTNNYGITSLVSSGTNKFNVYASGTAQNYFAGNVGIGTSSPATQFVVSNAGAQGVEITGSTGSFQVYNRSTSAYGTANIYANTFYVRTGTSPAINLTVDANGNVGVGVTTPSASWSSGFRAIQISGQGMSLSTSTSSNDTYLNNNGIYNGTNWLYLNTAPAAQYRQIDNAHRWLNAPSGTAGNAITFTQAMTLSAAGGLSVGTTTDANSGNILLNANGKIAGNAPTGSTSSTIELYNAATGNMNLTTGFSSASITFATASTERARIDSSGNLMVGRTSSGARLDVQGTTSDSSANALFIRNSSGNAMMVVRNDGRYVLGNGTVDNVVITSAGELLVGFTSATGVAKLQVSGAIRTSGFTVATLPAGTVGMRTYVTDALAPSFSATVTGGGAVTIPVFYNGTNWIVA